MKRNNAGLTLVIVGFVCTAVSMIEYDFVGKFMSALAFLGTSLGTLGGRLMGKNSPTKGMFPK